MSVAVIGGGSWGTALSCILGNNGRTVQLWTRSPDHAEQLQIQHENDKYLPGVTIPATVNITSDITDAVQSASMVIFAVPSQSMRSILAMFESAMARDVLIVSAAKGFEVTTGLTMSQVIGNSLSALPEANIAVLSGPTIAFELGNNLPGACVIASKSMDTAQKVQQLFQGSILRTYTEQDVQGVEIGGAVKNVIAIASGICDGLAIGDNGKAAIITRGLAELARFGEGHKAKLHTFAGLSGLGDCIVTCMSRHSRNRRLGEAIGMGATLDNAIQSMHGMVAEGLTTVQTLVEYFHETDESMPIAHGVYEILFNKAVLKDVVMRLMQRSVGTERRDRPQN